MPRPLEDLPKLIKVPLLRSLARRDRGLKGEGPAVIVSRGPVPSDVVLPEREPEKVKASPRSVLPIEGRPIGGRPVEGVDDAGFLLVET